MELRFGLVIDDGVGFKCRALGSTWSAPSQFLEAADRNGTLGEKWTQEQRGNKA